MSFKNFINKIFSKSNNNIETNIDIVQVLNKEKAAEPKKHFNEKDYYNELVLNTLLGDNKVSLLVTDEELARTKIINFPENMLDLFKEGSMVCFNFEKRRSPLLFIRIGNSVYNFTRETLISAVERTIKHARSCNHTTYSNLVEFILHISPSSEFPIVITSNKELKSSFD